MCCCQRPSSTTAFQSHTHVCELFLDHHTHTSPCQVDRRLLYLAVQTLVENVVGVICSSSPIIWLSRQRTLISFVMFSPFIKSATRPRPGSESWMHFDSQQQPPHQPYQHHLYQQQPQQFADSSLYGTCEYIKCDVSWDTVAHTLSVVSSIADRIVFILFISALSELQSPTSSSFRTSRTSIHQCVRFRLLYKSK